MFANGYRQHEPYSIYILGTLGQAFFTTFSSSLEDPGIKRAHRSVPLPPDAVPFSNECKLIRTPQQSNEGSVHVTVTHDDALLRPHPRSIRPPPIDAYLIVFDDSNSTHFTQLANEHTPAVLKLAQHDADRPPCLLMLIGHRNGQFNRAIGYTPGEMRGLVARSHAVFKRKNLLSTSEVVDTIDTAITLVMQIHQTYYLQKRFDNWNETKSTLEAGFLRRTGLWVHDLIAQCTPAKIPYLDETPPMTDEERAIHSPG